MVQINTRERVPSDGPKREPEGRSLQQRVNEQEREKLEEMLFPQCQEECGIEIPQTRTAKLYRELCA